MKTRSKELSPKWGVFAALPAICLALIPHMATCPACWPLIGGIVSALGLGVVLEGWLAIPLTLLFLILAFLPFALRAKETPKTAVLALIAVAAIVAGRFFPQYPFITYGGITLFLAAYAWQWWNSRQKGTCLCADDDCPPIACSLDRIQFKDRKELLAQITKAATEKRAIRNGYALTFSKTGGLIPTVASFIEMEQACCPFLSFQLEVEAAGTIQFKLTGPTAAKEIIRELLDGDS